MKTQVPAPAGPSEGDAPTSAAERRAGKRRRVLGALGGAVAVVAVVVPFFASTYAVHSFSAPLRWDTPKYKGLG